MSGLLESDPDLITTWVIHHGARYFAVGPTHLALFDGLSGEIVGEIRNPGFVWLQPMNIGESHIWFVDGFGHLVSIDSTTLRTVETWQLD